jgi:hypothetical protein
MFKSRLRLVVLPLAVVFGLGVFLGVFLPRLAGLGSGLRAYNTAVVLKQVQTLSQLVTIKYVMEKVEVLEDPPQNFWRQFLPDNTRVILVAHGIVKAGVDLQQLKPENVRVSGKKVVIALPRAQITDAYLDEKQTQVIEHNPGFLRTFNKDLEQSTRQNALDDIRRAAREAGILKEADERARAQLANLMTQLGFEQVEIDSK